MTSSHMHADANTVLVQRLIEEVWNQGNVNAVEELVAADYVNHDLIPNVYLLI
jgi:hypothetical protein